MRNKQVLDYIKFTEFFIACIILGLEYLHYNNILHRDIKPENLVMEQSGYLRITDFGISKDYIRENKVDTSGTPGYMAPEVIGGKNHTIAVDYFALGIITYELMLGQVFYLSHIRDHLKGKIKKN